MFIQQKFAGSWSQFYLYSGQVTSPSLGQQSDVYTHARTHSSRSGLSHAGTNRKTDNQEVCRQQTLPSLTQS